MLTSLTDRKGAGPVWLTAGVIVAAWIPRVRTASQALETYDETLWLGRSARFVDALASADLSAASAAKDQQLATMPGVTTMWTGALGRGIWGAGHGMGAWASDGPSSFATSDSGRLIGQMLMATLAALLIGLLTVLVAQWAGWRAAAVTGLLVATEPFLVAQGAVVHTDEMRELLGASAMVATALALGVPKETRWTAHRRHSLLAGTLFALALLTKLAALTLLPGLTAMRFWAHRRQRFESGRPADAENEAAEVAVGGEAGGPSRHHHRGMQAVSAGPDLMRGVVWPWVGAAVVTFVVLYPALWVNPGGELSAMWRSAGLAGSGEPQFFLGNTTHTPGPLFYVVALPLRITPWFMLGGLVALAAIARRPTRAYGWALAAMAGPSFVVLSLAGKQYARYGLLLLIIGAIAVGIVAASLWPEGRRPRRVFGAIAVVVAVHTVVVAPWGMAYFNPVLGGGHTAEEAVEVGNGEGLEQVDAHVRDLVHDDCDDVTIAAYLAAAKLTCGTLVQRADAPATYVLLYVSERQRMPPAERNGLIQGRDLVDRITIRGITYVEIFGPTSPEPAASS